MDDDPCWWQRKQVARAEMAIGNHRNPHRSYFWVLGLIAVSFLIRAVALSSFPEIEPDEGLWTSSAKNYLEFGDPFMDGGTHMLLSPVFYVASLVLFKLFDPGIIVARWISVVAATTSVYFVYLVTKRLTDRSGLALLAGVFFSFDAHAVFLSRRALIEPIELCLAMGATALVVQRRGCLTIAAWVMALALLAKINIAFLLPVFAIFLLLPALSSGPEFTKADIWRAAVLLLGSIVIAGAVYGVLYAIYPRHFSAAFLFELDGVHFEGLSHPLVRVGRFGLDPAEASRTMIELFRESPFLTVMASCGLAVSAVIGAPGSALFAPWLLIGVPFFLGQMFQPLRYFYLLTPALAFFAAVFVSELDPRRSTESRGLMPVHAVVAGVYLLFNISYVSMSAFLNRGSLLREVTSWVRTNTQASERIMAAGYFCTDIPNRAYAYYKLANDPEQLLESIRFYGIDYVIYDKSEWRDELGHVLATNFTPVHQWSFGTVYRVRANVPPKL